ncbi:MAG TPA: TrmH family RNA methyltransferase [Acidimicrobiia bacterium]
MGERITSTANPLVKRLAALKERGERRRSGRYLVEGARELGRARDAGVKVEQVVVSPELWGAPEEVVANRLRSDGAEWVEMGSAAFSRVSVRRHPDGLAGVAVNDPRRLDDLALGSSALVLVIDGVEKPGNLGAMLRSADAAGADAVVVAVRMVPGEEPADLTSPNVIRASQGAVFSVPWAVAPVDDVVGWARRRGLALVAADAKAAESLWEVDLTGRTAVVVGAEAAGLSDVIRQSGRAVAIPMSGASDSLNASVAAALLLYEAVRQRSLGG